MDPFDRERLSDGECVTLFRRLFPLGFAGDDVVAEIAPEGWEQSSLLAVFHPSVEREVADLVGCCLWDIFSDNHEVMAPDGRLVDLGSFRGSGGFIADLLNEQTSSSRHDYLDFYMGTIGIGDRTDLTPVYRMIFRRLAAQGYDWRYTFPRLHVLRFDRDDDALPLAERLERERQDAELRQSLEDDHREALEAAKDRPPPETVQAYRQVYERLPSGWPPWD